MIGFFWVVQSITQKDSMRFDNSLRTILSNVNLNSSMKVITLLSNTVKNKNKT
jgi:hypothetical protein